MYDIIRTFLLGCHELAARTFVDLCSGALTAPGQGHFAVIVASHRHHTHPHTHSTQHSSCSTKLSFTPSTCLPRCLEAAASSCTFTSHQKWYLLALGFVFGCCSCSRLSSHNNPRLCFKPRARAAAASSLLSLSALMFRCGQPNRKHCAATCSFAHCFRAVV